MVADLAIYTVVHQPRRFKLPAQPIPRGASIPEIYHCLFDERMNERYFRKVAQYSYYPATRMFLDLVRKGMRLSIGFSLSLLHQAEKWDPDLLDLFRELVAEENVEIIGVEPYHSFLFLLDLSMFVMRMRWMAEEIERIFGKKPTITDTTEMCMSVTLYNALDTAGFSGAVMDGRNWVMQWRERTHLYTYSDERPYAVGIQTPRSLTGSRRSSKRLAAESERENGPYLLTRHLELSDDVGYRFSNRTWSGYPLYADTYADWIAKTGGDFVFLGWDFETFGEHHRVDSGIFDFMRALPEELAKRGVAFQTPSSVIERYSNADCVYHLPLPVFPTTWAGEGGMEFFLGNSAQQTIFQLMGHVYGMAKLTENPDLLDLAIWLAQSDNLHLIQWFGRSGPQAEVSSYFTPDEWWSLGPDGIIHEQQQVYLNALHAMEPYLPARLIRQARRKNVNKAPRRSSESSAPDLSHMARQVYFP
jgi:alpha-amylase